MKLKWKIIKETYRMSSTAKEENMMMIGKIYFTEVLNSLFCRIKQARKRHAHLEKLQRDDEQEERLFERHLDQKEEKEKNELDEVHRSEMKKGKNQRMAQNERQRLAVHHSDQRNQLEREQRQAHEMELRKWKRRRLICKL